MISGLIFLTCGIVTFAVTLTFTVHNLHQTRQRYDAVQGGYLSDLERNTP